MHCTYIVRDLDEIAEHTRDFSHELALNLKSIKCLQS